MNQWILSLLLMLPIACQAFTVDNNTACLFKIKVSNDHWWFDHTKTIQPYDHNYQYTITAEPKAYSYFTISIDTPAGSPRSIHTWKIFTRSDVHLEFGYTDIGTLQIFADQAQIW